MHAVKLLLDNAGRLATRESVHDNVFWRGAEPQLSLCVEAHGEDVSSLLDQLARSEGIERAEIIVQDDGRCSQEILARMQDAAGRLRAAIRIVRAPGAARGHAATHARTGWIVLLDGSSNLSPKFVATGLKAMETGVLPARLSEAS